MHKIASVSYYYLVLYDHELHGIFMILLRGASRAAVQTAFSARPRRMRRGITLFSYCITTISFRKADPRRGSLAQSKA
ncbi:MAG TPA: hypothetical protein DD735_10055 [Clostridiales bacterium]|nr:hypothetical protein [Clostridiales bacterium]